MSKKHTLTDYEPVAPSPRARAGRAREDAPEDVWPEEGMQAYGANERPAHATEAALETATETPAAEDTAAANLPARHKFELKRGHALSYAGLFLFTVVLYFRPYELFPALAGLNSIAYWLAILTLAIFVPTQIALEGNFTARPREVNLVLLLCVAALLSIPLAINPGEAWTAFNYPFIRAVAMFIVIVNVVRTPLRLKGLMFLALAVGIVLSVGAINDYRLGRLTFEGERVAGVVGGMFGNPNDLALHLVTMIPLAVGLLLSTRSLFAKPFYAVCACLMLGGVMVSFSRGGFLGLLGACAVLAWKLGRRKRLLMIVVLGAFFVVLLALAPGEYTSRLGTIGSVGGDASSSSRRDLLVRSVIVALRNPLFGVGIGNFHTVSIHELASHNAYTQVAAEMGLAAMVIYIMFLVLPLKRLRDIERATFDTRKGSRVYYLSVALQASLVGFMVSSFFSSAAYQFYLYYLVGYAVALRRIYEAETGVAVVRVSKKRRGQAGALADATGQDTQGDSPAPDRQPLALENVT
ncbi:MAG TPA: O-antigen ligase family protein [Pyrinomonadaceae bacterium]|jgi:O-antigen ligase